MVEHLSSLGVLRFYGFGVLLLFNKPPRIHIGSFNNILNHTNLGNPVGNLGSLLFGQSTQTVGGFGGFGVGNPAYNRRIDAQVRFSF